MPDVGRHGELALDPSMPALYAAARDAAPLTTIVIVVWEPRADALLALWAHVMELQLVCMLVPGDYISAASDARIRALHPLHMRLKVVQGMPYGHDGTRRMRLVAT